MTSNAARRLMFPEPQLDVEGSWEIRLKTGEHLLSRRARVLLGIGAGEPVSMQRLLAALRPADRARWQKALAAVFDPEGSGECSIEFRTAGVAPRRLIATGKAYFEGLRAVRVAGAVREVPAALAALCREAIDEALIAHPGHAIEFECWDEAAGEWDRESLLQAMRNLLTNAVAHAAPGEPVIVSVIDCGRDVAVSVASFGPHAWESTRRIVTDQGGHVDVTIDESATVVHMWLPKERSLQ